MSASDKTTDQSSNININGSVNAQGDFVGRDKIIYNIVLLGQFLDFAKVEGLIPKLSTPSDFESISAAFEATFSQQLDNDLAQATMFAGEVLGEVIQKHWIKSSSKLLPFRAILAEVSDIASSKLKEAGYWNLFCLDSVTLKRKEYDEYKDPEEYEEYVDVIWLHSLGLLWKKHFKTNRLYGIANKFVNERHHSEYSCWVFNDQGDDSEAEPLNIGSITNEQFRVIMNGLVIDLIRMSSTASDDIKFWQGLVDLLGPEKKSG